MKRLALALLLTLTACQGRQNPQAQAVEAFLGAVQRGEVQAASDLLHSGEFEHVGALREANAYPTVRQALTAAWARMTFEVGTPYEGRQAAPMVPVKVTLPDLSAIAAAADHQYTLDETVAAINSPDAPRRERSADVQVGKDENGRWRLFAPQLDELIGAGLIVQ